MDKGQRVATCESKKIIEPAEILIVQMFKLGFIYKIQKYTNNK